jgi:hypothetical protein
MTAQALLQAAFPADMAVPVEAPAIATARAAVPVTMSMWFDDVVAVSQGKRRL